MLEADVVAGAALVLTWLTAELATELADAALALLVIAAAEDPVAEDVPLVALPVELAVLLAQVAAVGRLVTPAGTQILSAYFIVVS